VVRPRMYLQKARAAHPDDGTVLPNGIRWDHAHQRYCTNAKRSIYVYAPRVYLQTVRVAHPDDGTVLPDGIVGETYM